MHQPELCPGLFLLQHQHRACSPLSIPQDCVGSCPQDLDGQEGPLPLAVSLRRGPGPRQPRGVLRCQVSPRVPPGVMPPDEYHSQVDNSAYTNAVARRR